MDELIATLRQQARDAAQAATGLHVAYLPNQAADAASDVWEAALLLALEGFVAEQIPTEKA